MPASTDHEVETAEVTNAIVAQTTTDLRHGDITTLEEVLSRVAAPAAVPALPAKLPLPAVITDTERKAIDLLPEVFGKVVPAERRALEPTEVVALVKERSSLDGLKKVADKRIADIRVTVFNHFDTKAEANGTATDDTPRDKDGFYVLADEEVVREEGKRFTREVRKGSPTLHTEQLEALLADPELAEIFTREDYLAMTRQIRVVDENKIMLLLRKKPELVKVIAKATGMSSPTSSFYMRDAK